MQNYARIFTTSGTFILALLQTAVLLAGPYDPPAGYYSSATGTGSTLKSQLHNIIDNHTVYSYDAARSILQDTDQDPNDPDSILLVYDRESLDVSVINPGGSIPGWDYGVSWNREHTWPKSRGVDASGPDTSDLHQLRPSDPYVNSVRGNLNFGGAYGQPYGTVYDNGATQWYPGDADAGMIARQEFYMAVRYDGSDAATNDLELASGNPGYSNLGDLDRMIEWHYEAVPDDFEFRRNDVIYDDYQHNRNPFIDRPEYVWSVFVDQQNDSQIAIGGETVGADGSTSKDIDMGRVIVGASVSTDDETLSIVKNGSDGTYFEVTTTGDATSSIEGRYNAFRTGGTDSTTIDVGLSAGINTSTAGGWGGTVTIDNLDVTTSGGTGHGANDADDVINISLEVLDHASPSFSADGSQNQLIYDFGTIPQGDPMPTFDFSIFNLEDTVGFTAALELDGFVEYGDTSTLATDLTILQGTSAIDAGTGNLFTATFDTSTIGEFSAAYVMQFSDEDLPGANPLAGLSLVLAGTVESAGIAGDFDADGDVDGEDFLIWQKGYGTSYDSDDLVDWQANFGYPSTGATATSTSVQVPEPASLIIMMLGLLMMHGGRGGGRRIRQA